MDLNIQCIDCYTAYDLKGVKYKGNLIENKGERFLVPCENGGYDLLDYINQKIEPLSPKDLQYQGLPSEQSLLDGSVDFVSADVITNDISRAKEISEVTLSFNSVFKGKLYSLSEEDLNMRSRELHLQYLKEHRQDLISEGSFHSKLLALETIHKELSLFPQGDKDNLEKLALESTVDSFLGSFDEKSGIQLISSGKVSSLLKREDKDTLDQIQKEYLTLIDSNPNITQKKLKEFSDHLFHIHLDGIRHYKKLKGYKK